MLFLICLIKIERLDPFTESINGDSDRLETVRIISIDNLRPHHGGIRFQQLCDEMVERTRLRNCSGLNHPKKAVISTDDPNGLISHVSERC